MKVTFAFIILLKVSLLYVFILSLQLSPFAHITISTGSINFKLSKLSLLTKIIFSDIFSILLVVPIMFIFSFKNSFKI